MRPDGSFHSIPMPPKGWISLKELRSHTGASERNLSEWRRLGLGVPEPMQISLGRRGTASYYPPETVQLIRRLNELRQQIRNADKWLWQLWFDGFKVDIRSWAKKHLDNLQKRLDGGVDAKSLRSPIGRQLSNRVRRAPDRDEFIRAWLAVAAGMDQLVSLYATAEPPIFDIMLKVSGLPSNAKPPDRDLRRELNKVDLSVGGLSKTIAADASEADLEQARRDWRMIAGLIEATEMIDWNAATAAWEARMRSLAGAALDPPSIRARKAQRMRPLSPPQIIIALRILWHESGARAAMLAALIAFRRSPYFSNVVSAMLAGAGSWFDGLPSREPALPEAPEAELRP
jgi:MerR HTH family regulatory protein